MKVTITEIQNPADALQALGLSRWLDDLNIPSEIDGVPVAVSRVMLSGGSPAPAPAAPVAAPPAKRKYAKRKAVAVVEKPAKASRKPKYKTAENEAAARISIPPREPKYAEPPRVSGPIERPHVSIRQRILDLLKSGPKRVAQIRTEPGLGAVDVSQHLYLMKKDGLVTLLEATGEYELVAA